MATESSSSRRDLAEDHAGVTAVKLGKNRFDASRAAAILFPLLSIVVFFAVWEVCVRFFQINRITLPQPSDIFQAIWIKRYILFVYSQTTLVEILAGFAAASSVGIPLGVLVFFSPLAKRALYPILVASQMVPKVAIAPVFVIWVGADLASKVLISFLIAFFPIVVSTVVGLEAVEQDMVRLFRSMGAGWFKTFTKLQLPSALPNIFAGLKIAMSLSVVGAVVGEFVAADRGLGYFLLYSNGQIDTVSVFAALVVLTFIGVCLFFLVEFVQSLFVSARSREVTDPLQPTM